MRAPKTVFQLDNRLLALLRTVRLRFGLAIALGALGGGLVVWQARLLSRALEAVFLGGAGLEQTWRTLWLLAALLAVRFALAWASESAAGAASATIREELRARLLARLVEQNPARRFEERTGELAAVAGEGVEALDAWFGQYLPQLAWAALIPLTVLLAVFPLDALTGWVLLLTAPLIPLFMALIGGLARPRAGAQWEALRALSAHFFDLLQGLTTLELLGRGPAQARVLERACARYADTTMAALRVAFLSALALELLATLSTAVVAVEIGLRLLYFRLTFLDAFWLLLLAPEFYLPLRLLGTRFHAGMAGSAAAARIFQILEHPVAGTDGGKGLPALRCAPEVRFEAIRLSYAGAPGPALSDLDLVLAPGTRTALVGPTGAGKSSLASLLLRFVAPDSGEIRIDGAPLSAFCADTWRAQVAWVGQSPHLFHDTVEANLRLARPEATREELVRAAELAGAHGFIERLAQGYATVVGEQGARLSSGQAQRIAVARAFLRDSPVLVLDEPTAHLDPESESQLASATARLSAGRTTLIVAHRLSTIFGADRIAVLDRGRIVAQGTHSELIARCPLYRSLVDAWRGEEGTPPEDFCSALPSTAAPLAPPAEGPARSATSGDPRTLRRLLKLARPFTSGLALSALLGFGTVAAGVGLMSAAAFIVATAALHPSIAVLQPAIVGVRFFGLSRGVLRYFERLVSHRLSLRLVARFRVVLFSSLARLAPTQLVWMRRGDLLARAMGDITALEGFYLRALAPALVAACVAAASTLFVGAFSPRLALVLLGFQALGGVGLPLVMRLLGKRPGCRLIEARAAVSAGLVDGALGLAELVAFGRAADYLRGQRERGAALAEAQRRSARRSGLQAAGAALVANAALLAIVAAAIPLVREGVLAAVHLPVLALAALTSFEAILALPGAAQQLEADLTAARRLFEIVDTPAAVAEPSRPEPLPSTNELSARGLGFRYPAPGDATAEAGPWVLEGIDLELAPGRHIAVVGPSGSGKSTLAALLARLHAPGRGALSLGGVDLARVASAQLRGRLGALLQGDHLFDASVRENLLLARPSASETEIARVLSLAQASDFVAALPAGLEARIGERGLRLSGGERQRLALARTLLRETPLLLLDEPTAGLDPATEARVLAGLRAHCEGRGLLLITHRLAGLEWMDEIAVLDAGRIVERGRHEELLARRGLYHRLWSLQAEEPSSRVAAG